MHRTLSRPPKYAYTQKHQHLKLTGPSSVRTRRLSVLVEMYNCSTQYSTEQSL